MLSYAGHTARTAQSSLSIGRQIDRFPSKARSAVAELTDRSPWFGDLLRTFPGLMHELARMPRGPQRELLCAMITGGVNLRTVAQSAKLPYWLHKLPPEAFGDDLETLPRSANFERLISNLLPEQPLQQAVWFIRVMMAASLGGEELALWTAKCPQASAVSVRSERWVNLYAFAWYSGQPTTAAHRLIRRPFRPTLSYTRAAEEVEIWQYRINLEIALGSRELPGWGAKGRSLGYEIVPLIEFDDYVQEAAQMENCLDRYGQVLQKGLVRVYSIRKNGRPVGNFEVGPHELDPAIPYVKQLRGPANTRADADMWKAATAWLGRQKFPDAKAGTPCFAPRSPADRTATTQRLWQPFVGALHSERHQRLAALAIDTGGLLRP